MKVWLTLLTIAVSCYVVIEIATRTAPSTLALAAHEGAASSAEAPFNVRQNWTLVWSDEFDAADLDRTKWRPEESCWGGGNNERQCYTDRPENIVIEGGALKLIAQKENFEARSWPPEFEGRTETKKQPYTSGKVRTRGLAGWKYGRFEVRAKPPQGQGLWAAVWMMPVDNAYGGWPLSGEIDILEAINLGAECDECAGSTGENRTLSALHFGSKYPDNQFVDRHVALPDGALPSDDFHIWAVEWGEGLFRFFLNDALYFTVTEDQWQTGAPNAQGNAVAPFDQPFYIMANLAVGGKLSEEYNAGGIDPASIPAAFEIDWIRVYQCEADRETGLACMN